MNVSYKLWLAEFLRKTSSLRLPFVSEKAWIELGLINLSILYLFLKITKIYVFWKKKIQNDLNLLFLNGSENFFSILAIIYDNYVDTSMKNFNSQNFLMPSKEIHKIDLCNCKLSNCEQSSKRHGIWIFFTVHCEPLNSKKLEYFCMISYVKKIESDRQLNFYNFWVYLENDESLRTFATHSNYLMYWARICSVFILWVK